AHLVSDVPVGVLLSGGIDSSALAALAAEESPDALRTFSIGFEERSFDELGDARLVAERYSTQHRELVLRPDAALLLPALPAATWCRTYRSASSSPAGSTPPRSRPSPPRRARTPSAPSRSGSRSARSTSSATRASSPSATRPSTASSSSGPTRHSCFRRWPR